MVWQTAVIIHIFLVRCIQIADFGLSRDLQKEDFYLSKGGRIPVKWTAPEALTHRMYSTASDVWSYGVLLYEIWGVGIKPYHNCSNSEVTETIAHWTRILVSSIHESSHCLFLYRLYRRYWKDIDWCHLLVVPEPFITSCSNAGKTEYISFTEAQLAQQWF